MSVRKFRLPALALALALSAACAPATPPAAHQHAAHQHGSHRHGFHKDFSDAQAFSASFDHPERDAWQQPEALLDLMHIQPGTTVVDLGAGTGYFVARLSRRVGPTGRVLALDVEPNMVGFLQRRARDQNLPNVEARLVQPSDPALPPASASRILIVNTWHHIDERPQYAKKLAAALDPTGEVWIVDFTLEAQHGPPPEYRLSPQTVIHELQQGGLHAELIAPEPLPDQYIIRARR